MNVGLNPVSSRPESQLVLTLEHLGGPWSCWFLFSCFRSACPKRCRRAVLQDGVVGPVHCVRLLALPLASWGITPSKLGVGDVSLWKRNHQRSGKVHIVGPSASEGFQKGPLWSLDGLLGSRSGQTQTSPKPRWCWCPWTPPVPPRASRSGFVPGSFLWCFAPGGRRLSCGCSARGPDASRWEHYRSCASQRRVSHPGASLPPLAQPWLWSSLVFPATAVGELPFITSRASNEISIS